MEVLNMKNLGKNHQFSLILCSEFIALTLEESLHSAQFQNVNSKQVTLMLFKLYLKFLKWNFPI